MPDALSQAQILELSGADSCAFAHAQFSSDVERLSDGQWQWSAWLDPNGRVRNLFALLRSDGDRLLLWLPRGDAATMASRLSMYVLRSKVRIRSLPDRWLLALRGEGAVIPPQSTDVWLLDLPGSVSRHAAIVNDSAGLSVDPDRLQAWTREDIAARLPWIGPGTTEEFTAHALGLDRLGAISLDKGCYPGQEIVARLHYRGGNKRECVRVRLDAGTPPDPGTRILVEGTPASSGQILYAAQAGGGSCEALAVLPIGSSEASRMVLESGAEVTPEHLNSGAV